MDDKWQPCAEHQNKLYNHKLTFFINQSVTVHTTAMDSKFSIGLFSHIPMHTWGRYQYLNMRTLYFDSDGAEHCIRYCDNCTCSVGLRFLKVVSLCINTLLMSVDTFVKHSTIQLFVKLPNTSCTCNSLLSACRTHLSSFLSCLCQFS